MMAADEGTTEARPGNTVRDALDKVESLRQRSQMRTAIEDLVRWFAERDISKRRDTATRLRLRDA